MIDLMLFNRLMTFILLAALSLSLAGCWFVYKPDIKQGNVLTTKSANAIQLGMTQDQVVAILGKPILVNVFEENQMIYVYTVQPGHGSFKREQLRIYFENGRVIKKTSNILNLYTEPKLG